MSFTEDLAERAVCIRFDELPEDVVELARQCLLDWIGVALAGSVEPAATLLADELLEHRSADGGVTLVGRGERLPVLDAALVNGTASHALDYDDVNEAMTGHPSVPVLPALLALAEQRHCSGRAVAAAFVAGYETECRVARAVGVEHYLRGFHTTGTAGAFGAAAACAHLLGLDCDATATALGIAATQAAGLKSMFGTMCKPLHAGKAASNGLLAARLAARGYTTAPGAVETVQGFAETHSDGLDPERGLRRPRAQWHLRDNLFKYHAACFATHSSIEGLRGVRAEHGIEPGDIEQVTIHANPMQMRMCAIPDPVTGLEAKFSLRQTAAMTLTGRDTSATASFDAGVLDDAVVALRSRVTVAVDGPADGPTPVEVSLRDGRTFTGAHDVSVPQADLGVQAVALGRKFHALAEPVLGSDRAEALRAAVEHLDRCDDVATLMLLAAR